MKFGLLSVPRIIFGPGELSHLPGLMQMEGTRFVLVSGSCSFRHSARGKKLEEAFRREGFTLHFFTIGSEPTGEMIDDAVGSLNGRPVDAVVAIGGGSVLDAGKAMAAMLGIPDWPKQPVSRYLEEIGDLEHPGTRLPFIAVPTTAGTGSEATKNAVISGYGNNPFKKSLRHDHFIPDIALVDPELTLSCPPEITAACGLDAFTQLLESYLSTRANPVTDLLAAEGIRVIAGSLEHVCTRGGKRILHRSAMSYGALLSGITLANAGLGVVHGLAAPAGALLEVPHGVFCASLLPYATEMNIRKLEKKADESLPLLMKFARAGFLATGRKETGDYREGCSILVEKLKEWNAILPLDLTGRNAVPVTTLKRIAATAGNKNNPVNLSADDRLSLLKMIF